MNEKGSFRQQLFDVRIRSTMGKNNKFELTTEESFAHLPHAPIVEAVMDIRSQALGAFEETKVRSYMDEKLGDYIFLDSLMDSLIRIRIDTELTSDNINSPGSTIQKIGWKGLRFQSKDKKQIVQFNRDGFVFSRLEPYENWQKFCDEGLRLWRLYLELAQPLDFYRIGLRYINRIQLKFGELNFEDYIEHPPTPPKGLDDLPFNEYTYQDTLVVPDHPYAIKIIRTIQRPEASGSAGLGLILDIDVIFGKLVQKLDETKLIQHLQEMRWLKNKTFFGSITPKTVELLK